MSGPSPPRQRGHAATALVLAGIAAAMVGLSFASVPLYRMFCQATGFGGTTQRAAAAPGAVSERTVTVRFDTNVAPGLPWRFEPVEREMQVRIGENRLAFFRTVNLSGRQTEGTATFNVTPETAGAHFSKIQCFCFESQTLGPHQQAELPVSFFVDPGFLEDGDTKNFQDITLSYTFFPAPGRVDSAAGPERADPAAGQVAYQFRVIASSPSP
jgi:cytochrome c oxidase assembly protein subunit 11